MVRRHVILRAAGSHHEHAGAEAAPVHAPPDSKLEAADLSNKDVHELRRDPTVRALAPSMPVRLVKPKEEPNAASADAWGVRAVRADASSRTGAGTLVAVLDTGIDRTHPAFAGMELVEKDFTGAGNGDRNGHGTHCAGTLFGRSVNGTRIGVAPGIEKALIGKVLGDDESASSDALFSGIEWAVQQGAAVISLSVGFDFSHLVRELADEQGLPLEAATSLALDSYRANLRLFDNLLALIRARIPFDGGTVVVAAAGNESALASAKPFEVGVGVPAAAEGVLSVGAVAANGAAFSVWPFSNTHPLVVAPGVNILSAVPGGGLGVKSGTSMAAPHVAGVAALEWQATRAAGLPANAGAIAARVLAATRSGVFTDGTQPERRGNGLVTAPA